MAMGARGECRFDIGEEEERAVLFTNAALMTAERELGKTLPGIIRQLAAVDLSLTNCRTLLRIGLETARRENHEARASYTDADAQKVLDLVGYFTVTEQLSKAIIEVFNYGRVKNPEDKQADENPPE